MLMTRICKTDPLGNTGAGGDLFLLTGRT